MSWGKMAVSAYKTAKVIVKDPSWVDDEEFKSRLGVCEGVTFTTTTLKDVKSVVVLC